jgi:hypothetical protein
MTIRPELEAAMEPIQGVLGTFADLEPVREPDGDEGDHEHIVVHAGEAITLLIREPNTGCTVRGVFTLADVPTEDRDGELGEQG